MQLACKISLLVTFLSLRFFVKSFTAYDKYSLPNSYSLSQPIQMQVSKNLKTSSQSLAQFLESISNVKNFERNR